VSNAGTCDVGVVTGALAPVLGQARVLVVPAAVDELGGFVVAVGAVVVEPTAVVVVARCAAGFELLLHAARTTSERARHITSRRIPR
jgi:hypothetical protein